MQESIEDLRLLIENLRDIAIVMMGKTRQTEKISHRIPDFEAYINLRLNLLTTLPLSP